MAEVKGTGNDDTLNALGIDEDYALRISFDYTNTKEEIDYFLKTLKEILNKYA